MGSAQGLGERPSMPPGIVEASLLRRRDHGERLVGQVCAQEEERLN